MLPATLCHLKSFTNNQISLSTYENNIYYRENKITRKVKESNKRSDPFPKYRTS